VRALSDALFTLLHVPGSVAPVIAARHQDTLSVSFYYKFS
jgi:hypothetical protein